MVADIPYLFSGPQETVPAPLCWAYDKGLKFYVQWFGKLCKLSGKVLHKWSDGWVPCDKNEDKDYFDAQISAEAVELITGVDCQELADGKYWMVGGQGVNPYGFRMPMLIPIDFTEILFTRPITKEGFRDFLLYSPHTYGVMLSNGTEWAHVDGSHLGLPFCYAPEEAVPPVREGNTVEEPFKQEGQSQEGVL